MSPPGTQHRITLMNISSTGGQRPDFAQMREQLFKKTDADSSGSITQEEFTTALSSRPSRPGGSSESEPSAEEVFAAMDTDSSGEVTETEHTAYLESVEAARAESGEAMGGPGGPPPPPDGGGDFAGSTDSLKSLLESLSSDSEDGTITLSEDQQELVQSLLEKLQEKTGYTATGSTSTTTSSLFSASV